MRQSTETHGDKRSGGFPDRSLALMKGSGGPVGNMSLAKLENRERIVYGKEEQCEGEESEANSSKN